MLRYQPFKLHPLTSFFGQHEARPECGVLERSEFGHSGTEWQEKYK